MEVNYRKDREAVEEGEAAEDAVARAVVGLSYGG